MPRKIHIRTSLTRLLIMELNNKIGLRTFPWIMVMSRFHSPILKPTALGKMWQMERKAKGSQAPSGLRESLNSLLQGQNRRISRWNTTPWGKIRRPFGKLSNKRGNLLPYASRMAIECEPNPIWTPKVDTNKTCWKSTLGPNCPFLHFWTPKRHWFTKSICTVNTSRRPLNSQKTS